MPFVDGFAPTFGVNKQENPDFQKLARHFKKFAFHFLGNSTV